MRCNQVLKDNLMFQFTHPRGVRYSRCYRHGSHSCFNSRTREGCDVVVGKDAGFLLFQFTHPRGVRFEYQPAHPLDLRFNSRTREGCDLSCSRLDSPDWSFNSRTREGCDSALKALVPVMAVSIHAPARGAIH